MVKNIGVLGYFYNEYARSRIIHEIKALRKKPVKLDLTKLSLTIDGKLRLYQPGINFDNIDVVIPRFSTHLYRFGLMTMRQLKDMRVPTINDYRVVRMCQNKYLTSMALKKARVPQPRSMVATSPYGLLKIIKKMENPVIFKLLHGGKGTGVALINTCTEAEDWLTTIGKMGKMIYVQEYIPHEHKEDYRLFVVDGKVVGAMRRIAMHGWKTNFSLGNKVEAMKPSAEITNLALRAAKAVGAELCGVDIMSGTKRDEVIEVNQQPGFQGLEKATGKNIAKTIVKYAIKKAKK